MSDAEDDLAKSWLSSIKNRPAIAIIVVAATILAGGVGLLANLQTLTSWLSGSFNHPVVTAITLSPTSTGYEDVQDHLFAASKKLYRTFKPQYPWNDPPLAVFLVTISNRTKQEIVITDVVYEIEKIGTVKGGTSGPLNALASYHHQITHEVGAQKKSLVPTFRISSESSEALELQITSTTQESGLAWLMKIGFISTGGKFYTESFQLYLPKGGMVPREGRVSPPAQKPTVNTDILQARRSYTKLPDIAYRDCIFRKANVLESLEKLDQLDRDLLFVSAGYKTIDEFRDHETDTDPPIPYRELISPDQIEKLLTLVKSRSPC
jgi:hypothetical protein